MAWYNASWSYRVKVTIDATKVASTQTDFPVLLTGSNFPAAFWSNVDSAGDDIVVTSSDGTTKLKRELVGITTGSSLMELWVKVPSLDGTTDTELYVYYGNAGASETNDTDTWESNFMAVWHMNDDPDSGGTQQDSTANNRDGTSGGSMTTADLVAGPFTGGVDDVAWDLDGTDDYMDIASSAFAGNDVGTIEFWAKLSSTSPAASSTVWWLADKDDGAGWADNAAMYIGGGNLTGAYADESALWTVSRANNPELEAFVRDGEAQYADDAWHHWVVTIGSANGNEIFIDGSASVGTYRNGNDGTDEFSNVQNWDTTNIGRRLYNTSTADGYFKGALSHFKISSIGRTDDYVSTTWLNQGFPASFYSVGAEEAAGTTATLAAPIGISVAYPALTVSKDINAVLAAPIGIDVAFPNPAITTQRLVTLASPIGISVAYPALTTLSGSFVITPNTLNIDVGFPNPVLTRTPTPPTGGVITVDTSGFIRMATKASLLSMFKAGEPLEGGRKFSRLMEGCVFKDELDKFVRAAQAPSTNIITDTTNFDGLLSSADTTVQKALDTIDDAELGDHGGLTGLADDDHLQYLTTARGDSRYPVAGQYVKDTPGIVVGRLAEWVDSDELKDSGILTTEVLKRAEWNQNGFPDATEVDMDWDDATRTLTVQPSATSFRYYIGGELTTETGTLTAQITDTEGLWAFYIDDVGDASLTTLMNPSEAQVESIILNDCFVAYVYWDATNNDGRLMDERHGSRMSPETHHYLHETRKASYYSGMTPGDILADQNGSSDTHAQFSITAGRFYDEDIQHNTLARASTDTWEIYYVDPSGYVRWLDCEATFPVYAIGGVIAYNNAGTMTAVSSNKYVLYHVFATNIHTDADADYYPVMTPGTAEYATKTLAEDAALSEIQGIDFGEWPSEEVIPVATIIYQHGAAMSNGVEAAIQSTTGGGDFIDWRYSNVTGSSTSVNDHGALSGLSDDDHTQYIRHALATAANDFLVASGSGVFVKKTLAETGAILEADLDHGNIQGLGDDDHTQYLLANGTRALTGNWDVGAFTVTVNELKTDTISEESAAAGVTIDGVTIKDGLITTAAGDGLTVGDATGAADIVLNKDDASLSDIEFQSEGVAKWQFRHNASENWNIRDADAGKVRLTFKNNAAGGDTIYSLPTTTSLFQVFNSGGTVVHQFSQDEAVLKVQEAVPADGDLFNGSIAFYADSSDHIWIKYKDSSGTTYTLDLGQAT